MTPDGDFDRTLTAWLEDEAAPHAPAGTDTVFDWQLVHTRQRPGWATTERWFPMEARQVVGAVPRALLIAITLLLLTALVAGTIAIGASLQERVPPPFGLAANGVVSYSTETGVWVSPVDGSEPVRLTEEGKLAGAPVFSRSGTRFSHESSAREDGPPSIMVRDADGTNPIALTDGLDIEPSAHTWSPDDTMLLFSGSIENNETEANGAGLCNFDGAFCGSRIYRAMTDGSGYEIIGDPELDARAPTWAVDGSFIVFAGSPAGTGGAYRLYRMDPDGLEVERIGDMTGVGWTFLGIDMSPDGKRLVTHAGLNERNDIFIVDLETGEATRVEDTFPDAFHPSWSPDGTRILFGRNDTSKWDPKPVIVDAETLELRTIEIDDFKPWRWSPDGTSLLGFSDDHAAMLDISGETLSEEDLHVIAGSQGAGDVDWQRLAN
jgi:dipeptidyl aminopeptidase/acylaminoacyl peptidase